MRTLFIISGLFAILMIFWAALEYLMDLSSFPLVFPLSIFSILVFLGTGFLESK